MRLDAGRVAATEHTEPSAYAGCRLFVFRVLTLPTQEIPHQGRYHAAIALLDGCAVLARLAHAAAEVVASDEPCAVALAGGRRLRAATRVGVFAWSFNPLTRAHVALVNAARRVADLDALVWACAAASVDKERVERAALVG